MKIIVPRISDPRVLILSFFAIFIGYALHSPGFARTPEQFLLGLFTCLALDFALSLLLDGRIAVPMSGIVSAMGVFLLTDAEEPLYFFLCAVLTILSKHFLRIGERHVFNPNNFGIVILLLAVPDYVSSNPTRWGGNPLWSLSLFILGITIAFRVKRASVGLSYYGGFMMAALARSFVTGAPWLNLLAPLFGPGSQLFIFFMITDPKTSPSSLRAKIGFGLSVALLDNYMRYMEIRQAPLFTLFLITASLGVYRCLFPDNAVGDSPWRTKEIRI